MRGQNDSESEERAPATGSAGDGGVVEAGGTLGGGTANEAGEIVRAPKGTARIPASTSDEVPAGEDALGAAGTDANSNAEPPTGDIQGYEDLESDPGV